MKDSITMLHGLKPFSLILLIHIVQLHQQRIDRIRPKDRTSENTLEFAIPMRDLFARFRPGMNPQECDYKEAMDALDELFRFSAGQGFAGDVRPGLRLLSHVGTEEGVLKFTLSTCFQKALDVMKDQWMVDLTLVSLDDALALSPAKAQSAS